MPPIPQYVQRRGMGTFHVRIAVPKSLRPYLKRSEIKQSLATKDPAEALVKAQRFRNTILKVFEECRAMKKRQDDPSLHQFIYSVTRPDGSTHSITVDRENVAEEAALIQEAVAAFDRPPVPISSASAGELLSVVIGKYVADKEREKAWTLKTNDENRGVFALLVKILGNIPVSAVGSKEARYTKDVLLKLPPNLNKDPKFRGKEIGQILEMNPEKAISNQTFNKHVSRISGLFEWAKRHGHISDNPFAGLKLRSTKLPHEERDAFSDEDLTKLFGTEIFSSNKHKHPFYYWLPLLGLYSGARIEELCQLHLSDIRIDDDVWVLDLNTENGKKLKNLASKRLIPVHKRLIELGFIDYVERLRDSGNVRLFPELKRQRDGYSQSAQKWFNARYRRKCGIDGERKSFHSFRHSFGDALKQLGVEDTKISAVLGHKFGSISIDRYGKPYRSKALQAVVDLVSFPIEPDPFRHSPS